MAQCVYTATLSVATQPNLLTAQSCSWELGLSELGVWMMQIVCESVDYVYLHFHLHRSSSKQFPWLVGQRFTLKVSVEFDRPVTDS